MHFIAMNALCKNSFPAIRNQIFFPDILVLLILSLTIHLLKIPSDINNPSHFIITNRPQI